MISLPKFFCRLLFLWLSQSITVISEKSILSKEEFLVILSKTFMGRKCETENIAKNSACDWCYFLNQSYTFHNIKLANQNPHVKLNDAMTIFIQTFFIWNFENDNLKVNETAIEKICDVQTLRNYDQYFLKEKFTDKTFKVLNRLIVEVSKNGFNCNIKEEFKTSTLKNPKIGEVIPQLGVNLIECFNSIRSSRQITNNKNTSLPPFNWRGCASAFFACFLNVLLGLLGFILIPLRKYPVFYTFTLQCLTSLAFGTLVGDSLLHLLPNGLNLEINNSSKIFFSDGRENTVLSLLVASSYIWKFLTLLCGVMMFYLLEVLVIVVPYFKKHKCDHKHHDEHNKPVIVFTRCENEHHRTSCEDIHATHKGCADAEQIELFSENIMPKHSPVAGFPIREIAEVQNYSLDQCTSNKEQTMDAEVTQYNDNVELINVPCKSKIKLMKFVLMLLVGDIFHHLLDGLAVGAAFILAWPDGLKLGLTTSIAIACHELPHRLGDIAVLVKSGHSEIRSTIYVMISSLTSFIGIIIGILISFQSDEVAIWINVFTAGMFLYISLTMLIPQLVDAFKTKEISLPLTAIAQFIGMAVGIGVMFLMAIFEDSILIFN